MYVLIRVARPAEFTREQIIAATADVVASHGPANTTVARIASALRAPTGSIYHRVSSRDELLGEVWLRAVASFQAGFAAQLSAADAEKAGLAAVRYLVTWVRANPDQARVLLLYRRDDFVGDRWPPDMTRRAKLLRQQMDDGLRGFCRRMYDHVDARTMRIVTFALADAPIAALRPHLERGERIPPVVDSLIEATYRAAIVLERAHP